MPANTILVGDFPHPHVLPLRDSPKASCKQRVDPRSNNIGSFVCTGEF